jgi:hypothetical protein
MTAPLRRKAELAPGPGRLAVAELTHCLARYREMSPEMLLVVAVAAFTVLLAIIQWSGK